MELGYIFYENEFDTAYQYAIANGYNIKEIEPDSNGRRFQIFEDPKPTQQELYEQEYYSLKRQLSDMDYKTSKYVDGEYTDEEWSIISQERKQIRVRVRELEKLLSSGGN